MKLKEFIKQLKEIEATHGEAVEVKMADGISVKKPIYLENFINNKVVIITDKK